MPAQRHGSMAQQPTTLITFKFKIEDEGYALSSTLNSCADVVGWLAG
jgi:hypothetical protein